MPLRHYLTMKVNFKFLKQKSPKFNEFQKDTYRGTEIFYGFQK